MVDIQTFPEPIDTQIYRNRCPGHCPSTSIKLNPQPGKAQGGTNLATE